jgi:hypothetical protein
MCRITFGYTVGGEDQYYENLMRSIYSLGRIKEPHKILILDARGRIELAIDHATVIHFPTRVQELGGHFHPHTWNMRYHLYKFLETDYCFYMDADTLIVNDRVDELIAEAEDDFLICRHWWLPNLVDYLCRIPTNSTLIAKEIQGKAEIPFPAAGVFLFQKKKHDLIFMEVNRLFSEIFYDEGALRPVGITDELLLSLALDRCRNYRFTSGAMNHSCDNQQMPLELRETFYGKNPYDDEFVRIFAFHNNIYRFKYLSYFFQKNADRNQLTEELKKVCFTDWDWDLEKLSFCKISRNGSSEKKSPSNSEEKMLTGTHPENPGMHYKVSSRKALFPNEK